MTKVAIPHTVGRPRAHLSDRAREGSISAAIALERALRATPKSDEDWDDELSRIIADD